MASLLFVVVAGLAAFKIHLNATYFEGYDATEPLDPAITDMVPFPGETPAFMRTKLYFNGLHMDRVPTFLAMPLEEVIAPIPCVIFLHGIGQNKNFLNEIAAPFVQQGFAFCSFDQHMQGERKLEGAGYLEIARAFQQRPARTVNDTRRLIDYLQTRDDIAHNRIYLAGASYGAITGATAAAFDERLRAVALTYGGGNIRQMLTAREVAKVLGGWLPLAQICAMYLLGPADPVKYVGRISPRKVLLQNGTDDCLIPTQAARILQNAAREPKKIKWYQGDHIGFDKDTVVVVLNDIIEFLKEEDAKIMAAAAKNAA